MGRRVLVTGGSAGLGLLLALAAAKASAFEQLEFVPSETEFNPHGVPRDFLVSGSVHSAPKPHGPQRKGKRGKVRRW